MGIRVAALQVWTKDGQVEHNLHRGLQLSRKAIEAKAQLIVLPEAFAVGYCSTDLAHYAEDLNGATVSAFVSLAKHNSGVHIIFGMIRKTENGLYNSAILVGPSGVVGVYDKTHLFVRPSLPKINEVNIFRPGEKLGLLDTPMGRLGVMICYDGVHVELPRALVLGGADLLVWLNNRDTLTKDEVTYVARYNKVPVVAVVRVGRGLWGPSGAEEISCLGRCWIVDHRGKPLSSATSAEEEMVLADIDLDLARDDRWTDADLPIYLSRRPDLYGDLTRPQGEVRPS